MVRLAPGQFKQAASAVSYVVFLRRDFSALYGISKDTTYPLVACGEIYLEIRRKYV
jgi:hypothetical protein